MQTLLHGSQTVHGSSLLGQETENVQHSQHSILRPQSLNGD